MVMCDTCGVSLSVCIYFWSMYMCVHLQETNTWDSMDFQVSAERRPS